MPRSIQVEQLLLLRNFGIVWSLHIHIRHDHPVDLALQVPRRTKRCCKRPDDFTVRLSCLRVAGSRSLTEPDRSRTRTTTSLSASDTAAEAISSWPTALPTRTEPACWSRPRCASLPPVVLLPVQEHPDLHVYDPNVTFVIDVVEDPHTREEASTPSRVLSAAFVTLRDADTWNRSPEPQQQDPHAICDLCNDAPLPSYHFLVGIEPPNAPQSPAQICWLRLT